MVPDSLRAYRRELGERRAIPFPTKMEPVPLQRVLWFESGQMGRR